MYPHKGSFNYGEALLATKIPAFSASQNNLTPHGIAENEIINLSSTAEVAITGLSSKIRGTRRTLVNKGVFNLILTNQDENSRPENRFNLPNGVVALVPGATLEVFLDPEGGWRLTSYPRTRSDKAFWSGGAGPTAQSDRYSFTTSLMSVNARTNLSAARRDAGASGYKTKSFVIGGNASSTIADRITYATEVAAAVAGANFTLGRAGSVGFGTTREGWYYGGFGAIFYAVPQVVDYSTETTAAVAGATMSAGRNWPGCAGNAKAIYTYGGDTNGSAANVATAEKLDVGTRVMATLASANLPAAKACMASLANREKNYLAGGYTGATSTVVMPYATEVSATQAAAAVPATFTSSAAAYNNEIALLADSAISYLFDFSLEIWISQASSVLTTNRANPAAAGTGN